MIKIVYSFLKSKPEGGQPNWQEEIRLYDDSLSADELHSRIDEYKKNNHSGYHKHIDVKSITRL